MKVCLQRPHARCNNALWHHVMLRSESIAWNAAVKNQPENRSQTDLSLQHSKRMETTYF